MYDAIRHLPAGNQVFHQGVIALAPAFRRQHILSVAVLHIRVAFIHLDHIAAAATQALHKPLPDTGVVHENQPGELLVVGGAIDSPCTPDRLVEPIVELRQFAQMLQIRPMAFGLAGIYEVALMLKCVGRQRNAQPFFVPPQQIGIDLHAGRPKPAEHGEKICLVGDFFVRVTQRRQGRLPGLDTGLLARE